VVESRVALRLDEVPLKTHDPRGNPELEFDVSSDNLVIEGGGSLLVRGAVSVDRSRWIKDAQKDVDILRFTDAVALPEAPPPDIIRTLGLELEVNTGAPLRVDNNIASDVEADVSLQIGGTYEHPEFAGSIVLDSGGKVEVPFLSGSFEIQRGRIALTREVETAEVDIVALRQEPIYIEGQPRRLQLMLTGTLSAITPQCVAEGETTAALTTTGCFDYLVLGAGDVEISDDDARQAGGGGLANARKPLQVVSNVAEIDVNKRVNEAAPRLGPYIPDLRLRLGQVGPEVEVATPKQWFDFDYGSTSLGWDYTRGYPGYLLRAKREFTLRLEILDPVTVEYRRSNRSYLNERIIFDPLEQSTLELRFDFQIPSLR
jgi:hypothetical protein